MKNEFIRFGLSRLGAFTAFFQILGAIGLLIGIVINVILMMASAGLTLMMVLGVAVRIKVRDPFWAMLPALFFLVLNSYILYQALMLPLDTFNSLR
jgi:hypothetical protein